MPDDALPIAKPTRRAILLLATGVVGALARPGRGVAQAAGGALPSGQFTKEFAGYVASGGRDRCEQCTRYITGNGQDNGTCQLVEGPVSKDGWCKFYDD